MHQSWPYIDCVHWNCWEDYYKSRSKKFKRDYKESLNRLRRTGEPRFVVVDRQDLLSESLEWLFARKLEWLARSGFGTKAFSGQKDFYRNICREALGSGDLVLTELFAGRDRVAASLAFRAGGSLDCHLIAWDQGRQHAGPGRLVAVETIRWAFEHGIARINLGVGSDPYKHRLSDQEMTSAKDVFVASTLRGRTLLASRTPLHAIRRGGKALAAVLRKSKAR
jgi:CelD/BcsL family acetyltransferase involved in cellulose biosynthesis